MSIKRLQDTVVIDPLTLCYNRRALDEFIIEGVKTSIPLHKKILEDPDFHSGNISTKFMERYNIPVK
jgi:biotin carboxylase